MTLDLVDRHRSLVMLGVVRTMVDVDDDPWELDETSAAIVAALDAFDETRARKAPLRIPKGFEGGGRFRSISDRIFERIQDWAKGDLDNPFEGDEFTREHLRKAAKERGVTLRRGATFNEIANALLDDVRKGKGDRKPDDDESDERPAKKAPSKRTPAKKAAPKLARTPGTVKSLMSQMTPEQRKIARQLGLPDDHPLSRLANELDADLSEDEISEQIGDLHPDDIKQLGAEHGIKFPAGMRPEDRKAFFVRSFKAYSSGGGSAPEPDSVQHDATLDPEAARDALDLKKVPELKAMLRERGLPVSGRKRELVDRLVDSGAGAPTAPPSTGVRSGPDALTAAWQPVDLSPGERRAVDLYANDAQRINGLIRQGRTGSATIRDLDRVLDRSPLTSDVEIWRGLRSGDMFPDAPGDLTGVEWTDEAYLSTSANRRVAEMFAGSFDDPAPVVMRVHAPAGTGAIAVSEWGDSALGPQAEVLLQRGLRLRVVADHGVEPHPQIPQGVRRLDIEVVPDAERADFDRRERDRREQIEAVPEAESPTDELLDIARRLAAGEITKAEAAKLRRAATRSEDIDAETRDRVLALAEMRFADEMRAMDDNQLKRYWTVGEGLKRWRFHPHPWTKLRNLLRKHVGPGRAERMASEWFHVVLGYWPGHRKGSNPVGPG